MKVIIFFALFVSFFTKGFSQQLLPDSGRIKNNKFHKRGNDDADLAIEFEINRTKDPLTKKVPRYLITEADNFAKLSQAERRRQSEDSRTAAYLTWTERGSNTDAVGASNGNIRPNAAVTSGRIRAIWADLADTTGNTVWVGGVDGGIWKTTNITASPAIWVVVNDYMGNLAITGICQDPVHTNIMYLCTGESFYNSDAVNGNGVYKSIDGGINWLPLNSSTSFSACTKILCDATGNVYVATVGNGLQRSVNGGLTWTDITPSGLTKRIADFEISSTGRMHISCGLHTFSNGYRYSDTPSSVTNSTWIASTIPFVFPLGTNSRVELACSGNVLYAALSNNNSVVDSISKSNDGGITWHTKALSLVAKQTLNGSGIYSQAWYCLTVGINPANPDYAMIGNLNIIKTSDGGNTWIKGSEWGGTSGQYVHADQHAIVWYHNGNRLLFGSDGGIHFSADSGATIRDRNTNLRIKQFYSVAIHPTLADYFLAGAQDNGVHQFSAPGLSGSTEVTGGDGGYVAIDQDEPQYQFGSYVFNSFRRSVNNGNTWGSVDFYKGTSVNPVNFGLFINPFALDNMSNIIYAGADGGEIFRWTTPYTTPSGSYFQSTSWPAGATLLTGITNLVGNKVSAVTISSFTSNRVYFGTENGKLIYIDSANTIGSNTAGKNISGPGFSGTISSVNTGTDDQHIIVSFYNYNTTNIWISTNGGTTWTAIEGNLPDMPVRWAMFYPNSNTKAIIATEAGVWETDAITGNQTVWRANPTFPVVRTDMLQYRTSDGLLAAATHGRGLFTAKIPSCDNPVITVSFDTAYYCYGSTPVILNASGAETYVWNPMAGLSSATGSTVTANPSATTNYIVNGFDSAGCSSSATVVITVIPGVNVTATALPSSLCSAGSSVLNASASFNVPDYCMPFYAYGTSGGDFISEVSVLNTSLHNFSGASSMPYYTHFPASGNTTGMLYGGEIYYLSVKANSNTSSYIRAWIDFNQDGVFSSSESIGVTSNAASANAYMQFVIPLTAFNGTTMLRVRSGNIFPGAGADQACGSINSSNGETEDYTITIMNGTNPFNYLWSPADYLSAPLSNSATASLLTEPTTYTVTATSGMCSATATTTITFNACLVTLNLKVFLEGYYTSTSTMSTALYNLGMSSDPLATDTIIVNLWSMEGLVNATPDYSKKVILQRNGNATIYFPSSIAGNRFYIAVQHKNHIEIWSAAPVLFSSATTYDFSDGINKAYNDGYNLPMKNMMNVFTMYGGDVNQDGTVDGSDLSQIENDASEFLFGYYKTDVTGDGTTDASDLQLTENNAQLFLFYARPY